MIETNTHSGSIRHESGLLARRPEGANVARLTLAFWSLVERHVLLTVSLVYASFWTAFSLWHSVLFASIETDGAEYIQTARSLFTPNWVPSSFHGLGYPAAIWFVHVFVADWFVSAKVVSGLAGLAFVLASLGLAETLLDQRAALLAGLLIVTNFFLIAYSAIAMSDMLAAGLATSGLLILVRGSSALRYLPASVLVGLAAVTHFQYFGLIPALGLIGLLGAIRSARSRGWAPFFVICMFLIALLLTFNLQLPAGPVADRNFANLGSWFYSAEGAGKVHSWGDAVRLIAEDPFYFSLGYLRGVLLALPIYLPHVFAFGTLVAPGGWALLCRRPENRARVLMALGIWAAYLLVTGLSWMTEARFWIYLMPFIGIGAAYLLFQIGTFSRHVTLVLTLILILGNAAIAGANLPHYIQMQAPEFERAGFAIRDMAPKNAVILVTQPQIAYYAERPAVLLRDVRQSWADLPIVLSQNKIQYIVMDDRYGSTHYRELTKLLEPLPLQAAFPDWQLVYYEEGAHRIAVYRILTP